MLLDTTHKNDNLTSLINDCLGRPYSFLKAVRLGGIGSKRMIIEETSFKLKHTMNSISDINYANLELRPAGILIRINKGLRNFTWVIPYHKLVVYKSEGLSLHSEDMFIRFKDNQLLKENKTFITKMLRFKNAYLSNKGFL